MKARLWIGLQMPEADMTQPNRIAGRGSSLTYYAMNSEYKHFWQEVGCGTRTAQIIHDLGPGQFAAT